MSVLGSLMFKNSIVFRLNLTILPDPLRAALVLRILSPVLRYITGALIDGGLFSHRVSDPSGKFFLCSCILG